MHIVSSQRNSDLSQPRAIEPAKMRPLATLPVFFNLENKRVVLVGGTEAAAWKAELLCSAGAAVEVIAPSICNELQVLLNREWETGHITYMPGRWTPDGFAGAALVVADASSEAEARALVCAARGAGVPINVIDSTVHCDFQFGSIVNRSPVVIGISTNGAAPILGQAVRRRIETLLGPALGDWAQIAAAIRSQVMRVLKPGRQRRAFWERFADLAFGPAPDNGAIASLSADLGKISSSNQTHGQVTLAGAGPGDAELLTLKAVRALQSADVILFDDLVSDDVLELARREARRMLVGKRGGRESCRQDDINAMMVKLAKSGKAVVRLKSGDPMIFGRAGEEIAALERHNIPVTVVPGVTSALAMASALGVSLTHRDHAQSVRFVTAHSRHGELPRDLDWRAIADPKTTTIFYMGSRTAPQIVDRLIANGMSPLAPVAVAQALSRSDQKVWTGTLEELCGCVTDFGRARPVLIGIGAAFGEVRKRPATNSLQTA